MRVALMVFSSRGFDVVTALAECSHDVIITGASKYVNGVLHATVIFVCYK